MAAVRNKTLRQLAKRSHAIEVPRGTVLFNAGDEASALYIVLAGCVKLVLPRRSSEPETILTLLRAGELFDISAVFLDQSHLVSAAAVRKSRLARVPRQAVIRAIESEPELGYELTKGLSRRVHELLAQVRGAPGVRTGTYRLVNFLLQELPQNVRSGAATITLPASKRAIASKLQLTPEHLSRVLKRLVSSGLISVDGPRVTLHDVGQLRKSIRRDTITGRRQQATKSERRVSRVRALLADDSRKA